MPDIQITVRDKIASKVDDTVYVCSNSDYTVKFDFDDEWDAYDTKTARLAHRAGYVDVLFDGNTCALPVIHNADRVYVGVYAGELHTTTPAVIPCRKSILSDGGTPADPPDDVYAQLVAALDGKISEPAEDGKDGQVLKTNGAGGRFWGDGNTQSDYNVTDPSNPAYIKNRPFGVVPKQFDDVVITDAYADIVAQPRLLGYSNIYRVGDAPEGFTQDITEVNVWYARQGSDGNIEYDGEDMFWPCDVRREYYAPDKFMSGIYENGNLCAVIAFEDWTWENSNSGDSVDVSKGLYIWADEAYFWVYKIAVPGIKKVDAEYLPDIYYENIRDTPDIWDISKTAALDVFNVNYVQPDWAETNANSKGYIKNKRLFVIYKTLQSSGVLNLTDDEAKFDVLIIYGSWTRRVTTQIKTKWVTAIPINCKTGSAVTLQEMPYNAAVIVKDTGAAIYSYSRFICLNPLEISREVAANKVTTLSSSSTDTQYPSAKCVYDLVGNIKTLIDNL